MCRVGVIGYTGKVGKLLCEKIEQHKLFVNGLHYNRASEDIFSLEEVFLQNDYIIDFSNGSLVQDILTYAIQNPKPIILCSTNWQEEYHDLLEELSKKTVVFISPNNSLLSYLQNHFANVLARMLGAEYDIDILDRHHKSKQDTPSGTAKRLAFEMQDTKHKYYNEKYQIYYQCNSARQEKSIYVQALRTADVFGEHDVSFTSTNEVISIQHKSFNRSTWASGALRIVEWIIDKKLSNGLYSMKHIVQDML